MLRLYICIALAIIGQLSIGCVYAATTTPATTSSPYQNNYTVTNGNITCVVMTATIELVIPYTTETQNNTATIYIPKTFTFDGTCGNSQGKNAINIHFFNNWTLTIIFTNSTGSTYAWHEVDLTYALDNTHFPNISKVLENNVVTQTSTLPVQTMSAKKGGSYLCTTASDLQLNGSISMKLSGLQYRAFGNNNSTWFSNNVSDVQECEASFPAPETDVAIAITIGIALGAMLVIVVVLYIIVSKATGRREKHIIK